MNKIALGIIDAQRGFMPEEEGVRLGLEGFGELPVTDGNLILPFVNKLAAGIGSIIFSTQDWHPPETAHFSQNPNYLTNWPVHCVANSPGALLHPDMNLPKTTEAFFKGIEPIEDGEDDLSYSGYFGVNTNGLSLPEYLDRASVGGVVLGGLALDYCVGKTALDLKRELGLQVIVAIDATKAITKESAKKMLADFEQQGIETATTNEVLEQFA